MRTLTIPAIAVALVISAMVYQATTVETTFCTAPEVRLGDLEGFTAEELPASEAELTVLPSDTGIVKRQYSNESGVWFMVTAVIGGRSKSSVHRPELCLPSQGFQMTKPRTIDLGGVEWHLVSLARRDSPTMGFAYTFYNQEGFRTSSHLRRIFRDVWDRSVRGQIDRWVMVTVHSSTDDEGIMADFLGKLRGVSK